MTKSSLLPSPPADPLLFAPYALSGQALSELSKEKTSQKTAENHTQLFLKSLNFVESKLAEQINYLTQVSTGQPHEVSIACLSNINQLS